MAPSDVDAVCAAATGVDAIDREERTGIAAALGPRVPVAAPKSIYGETFGASGALGMATALAWLDGAPIAPLVSGKRPSTPRTVVVTTIGFYGNASAVVLGGGDK